MNPHITTAINLSNLSPFGMKNIQKNKLTSKSCNWKNRKYQGEKI